MTQTPTVPMDSPPAPSDLQDERLIRPTGARDTFTAQIKRIRTGDLGSLPVIVGLVIIFVIFQILNNAFLGPQNLSDLLVGATSIGVTAIGIVLVLLLGQIDLSVGSMAGLSSAIFGVLLTQAHWPEWVIVVVALAAGALVGLLYGFLFVRFGVPSFVITLAGLLALLGAQLALLGASGTINIPFTTGLVAFSLLDYVPSWLAYVLAVIAAGGYLWSSLSRSRKRTKAGLSSPGPTGTLVKAAILLVALGAIIAYLNTGGNTAGVGDSFVMFVILIVIMNYVLTRTRWGRSVYAVGGNVEAARRAGIKVNRVYIVVFVLTSTFAALGGLLYAGHLGSAGLDSGSGDYNLDAIAAAVIGGTSLFGGRGSAWSALLGILVIWSISNGLSLLSLDSSVRFMITGGVLLLAVIVDSLSRRSRAAAGRA
ncbi:MAG: transporter permease [Glaciihabitans sp.]|nr:transporter permease [Glaciihabitans sp.]